jgi:Holliday junction resolvase
MLLENRRLTGAGSGDKGARIEREIVTRHAVLGVKAERVPLSGATG